MEFKPVNIEIHCPECDETLLLCEVTCTGMKLESDEDGCMVMNMQMVMKEDSEIEKFSKRHEGHKICLMRYREG